jgi:hypothetical protein
MNVLMLTLIEPKLSANYGLHSSSQTPLEEIMTAIPKEDLGTWQFWLWLICSPAGLGVDCSLASVSADGVGSCFME